MLLYYFGFPVAVVAFDCDVWLIVLQWCVNMFIRYGLFDCVALFSGWLLWLGGLGGLVVWRYEWACELFGWCLL